MNGSKKTILDFLEIHQRNALVHAVRAAVSLGLVDALESGQKTAAQLAEALQFQIEPLKKLLNVLVQTELIEQYDDDFALSTLARLIPKAYLDFGDRYWEKLSSHIRGESLDEASGTWKTSSSSDRLLTLEAQRKDEAEDYQIQKGAEDWILTPVAMDAVQVLDIGQSRRGLRVLEIGANSAVFSATLAHHDPDSVINLADTPQGLARSRRTIQSIGLERQCEFIELPHLFDLEGSAELKGQSFDLVVLHGVLHRHSQEDGRQLLLQTRRLVKSGCDLAILDVFPGQTRGDRGRAIFELELGLRTHSGKLVNPNELKQMLQEIGFRNLQYAHLPSPPYFWGLLVAQTSD
jgi:hypothetical protein